MKKYGKYEKMPDGTRAKQPKAKSVLLQTYFTSLLCMILCVTMFFGTSYAWFTSEVNNTGNEIYIGILDVDLQDKDDNTLNGNANPLFTKDVHWEPGYTALETLQVVNEGDLAFRYELTFKAEENAALTGEQLAAVAKWFTVWCYHDADNTVPAPANYEQITAEDSGWTKVGTLAEVLSGEAVFSGSMTKEDVNATEPVPHTYTIALHMNGEDVSEADQAAVNALMGKSIGLNVKLVATQMSSEQDAFGGYDWLVATPAELKEALTAGGNVTLLKDVKLSETVTIPNGVYATLNLNGHTITAPEYVAGKAVCAVKNEGILTIEGEGTIVGNGYTALYSSGNLTVNGGIFTAGENFGLLVDNIYGTTPSVAVINGGTFSGVGVYNPTEVTINGGTFKEGRDPDGAMDKVALFVSPTFTGAPNTATVTLYGGTFDGDIYVYDDGITETVFVNDGATITGEVKDNS